MDKQHNQLLLFSSADEFGKRRNDAIFHLDTYLSQKSSEAQPPEQYAKELLSIVNGEYPGLPLDKQKPEGSRV